MQHQLMVNDNDPLISKRNLLTALKNHHPRNFACDPKSEHCGLSMMSRNDVEGSIASEGTFHVKYSWKQPSEVVYKHRGLSKGYSYGTSMTVHSEKIYRLCILIFHFLVFLCLRSTKCISTFVCVINFKAFSIEINGIGFF